MAKQYSMNGFLQSVDDYSYIEQYFRNRGINDFTYTKNTDRKTKKQSDEQAIKSISDTIAKQNEDTQQEIERDFSEINKLLDDKGRNRTQRKLKTERRYTAHKGVDTMLVCERLIT